MNIIYPYLPEGRTIRYVSLDNAFMREAKRVRDTRSTESTQPTGAVIVKENRVVAEGANQSKLKNPRLISLHKEHCLRKMLHIPTGTHYWVCPGCATHKQHAEGRSVQDAKNKGIDVRGADLYLYGHWWCCKPCWDSMIGAGIKDVYLVEGSEYLFNPKDSRNTLGKRL